MTTVNYILFLALTVVSVGCSGKYLNVTLLQPTTPEYYDAANKHNIRVVRDYWEHSKNYKMDNWDFRNYRNLLAYPPYRYLLEDPEFSLSEHFSDISAVGFWNGVFHYNSNCIAVNILNKINMTEHKEEVRCWAVSAVSYSRMHESDVNIELIRLLDDLSSTVVLKAAGRLIMWGDLRRATNTPYPEGPS